MKLLLAAKTVMRYWRMANDPRTPKIVKFLIYGGLIYTLSPVDILPDWMPLLGLIDDAAVLPSLISLSMLFIPKEVKRAHDAKEAKELALKLSVGETKAVEAESQARRVA